MCNKIDSFREENRFLSNFYPVNTGVKYGNIRFPTVEHAYQAAKAFLSSGACNRVILEAYALLPKPGMAKELGGVVRTSPEWNMVRISIMKDLLTQKYHDPVLKKLLIGTGTREIIEGNTWGDTFWGVCNGEGENNLGKLIMEVRTEISWSTLISS